MRRPDFFTTSNDADEHAFDAWLDGERPNATPPAALMDAVAAARRADAGVAAAVAHIDRAAMLRGVMAAVPARRSRRWRMPRPMDLLRSPALGFALVSAVLLMLIGGIRDLTRNDDRPIVDISPVFTSSSPHASPGSEIVPGWLTYRLEQTGHTVEIGRQALLTAQIPGIAGQDLTIDGVEAVVFPLQSEVAAAHAFSSLLPDTLTITDVSGTPWRDEQPTYVFWANHLVIVLYDAGFDNDTFYRFTQDVQTKSVNVGREDTPIDTGLMDWPGMLSRLGDEGFTVTDQFAAASTRSLTFPIVGIPDFGRLITINGRTAVVFALPRAELDNKGMMHELAPEDVFAQVDQSALEIVQVYGERLQPEGQWRAFLTGNVVIVIDDDPARMDDAADRMAPLFPAPPALGTPVASPAAVRER